MRLDEQKIQQALFVMLKTYEIIVPNVSWSYLPWEADMVGITKAGYLYEYEIKISLSDFKNDFYKRKYKSLKYDQRWNNRIPNYFSYVAPLNAIPLCIPDYAGLYEVLQNGTRIYFSMIRKPKILHRNKLSPEDRLKILRTIMFKYWAISKKLSKAKVQHEIFQSRKT